ncbi:MAG: glycogen debranching enzyme GlgX, partial [Deinococcales bacterium]
FTLKDLVSYEHKHNEANGERNHDGNDHSLSSNSGVEGPTDDPTVLDRRDIRRRSLVATLLLSQGIPMLLGGDELGRTQHGNNNAYCQDNELSWFDWELNGRDEDFLAFMRRVLALRREHAVFRRSTFLDGSVDPESGFKDVAWIHPSGREMVPEDWDDGDAFGMLLCGAAVHERDRRGEPRRDCSFLVVFHGRSEGCFVLPTAPEGDGWVHVLDTADPDGIGDRLEAEASVRLTPDGLSVYQACLAGRSSAAAEVVPELSPPGGYTP